MSEERNPLDELFRQSLEGAEMQAPPGVWEGVAAGIGTGTAAAAAATAASTGWLGAIWMKAAIAILAVGGVALGAYSLLEDKQEPVPTPLSKQVNMQHAEAPGSGDAKPLTPQEDAVNATGGATSEPRNAAPLPAKADKEETSHSGHRIHSQALPHLPAPIGHESGQGSHAVPQKHVPSTPEVTDPCANLPEVAVIYREVQPGVVAFSTGDGNWQQVRWNFGDGREGSGPETMHTYIGGKRFTVSFELLDAAGCARRGEKEIALNGSELDGNILIPNVFTPNADGINDPYRVLIVGQEKYRLSIYDRGGKVLYTGTDPEEGWNGMINGQSAPMGPYIARVEWQFYGHEPHNKTVVIMLKR
jgi:gliding motility-associated-like protein